MAPKFIILRHRAFHRRWPGSQLQTSLRLPGDLAQTGLSCAVCPIWMASNNGWLTARRAVSVWMQGSIRIWKRTGFAKPSVQTMCNGGKPSSARGWSRIDFFSDHLESAICRRDAAALNRDFRAHENQAPGAAHHAWLRDHDIANSRRIDKVRVHLNRREGFRARHEPGRHAAGAIRERHQQATLDHTAPVAVLVLPDDGIFGNGAAHPPPQRSDEIDESVVVDHGPAVRFEDRDCRVSHPWSYCGCGAVRGRRPSMG